MLLKIVEVTVVSGFCYIIIGINAPENSMCFTDQGVDMTSKYP